MTGPSLLAWLAAMGFRAASCTPPLSNKRDIFTLVTGAKSSNQELHTNQDLNLTFECFTQYSLLLALLT